MKTCTLCEQTKDTSEFSKHSQKKDGLNSWCKECSRKKNNARNAKTKDRKAAYDKEYRQKNAESLKAKGEAYRETHKEEKAAYDKKYREQQGEKRLAQKRDYYHNKGGKELFYQWAKNNPDKVRSSMTKTQIKRRGYIEESTLTSAELATWISEQVKFCPYCNTFCEDGYHIDHIEPLAKGGKHELDNLTIACPSCNQSKSAKSLIHWYATKQTDRSE